MNASLDLSGLHSQLLQGMRDFLADGEAIEYAESHIQQCGSILDEYLTAINEAQHTDAALACVKTAVLRLNRLNDECDGLLIETDQSDNICKFIIGAGAEAGFNADDEDVTEHWREW